jgi:hypothetical protein
MNAHKDEIGIITAVIDLAASRREPVNAYGDYDEWLTFEAVCSALEDVSKQLRIGKNLEQNCYQTLLRMSAESEQHLTWWEKMEHIERYLHPATKASVKRASNPDRFTMSLPSPSPHLIRFVEPEKGMHVDRRTSAMDTRAAVENEQLSMILNGTYGIFQSGSSLPSTTVKSPLRMGATGRSSFVNHPAHLTDSARRRIHFSDRSNVKTYSAWQAVNDKLSDIQQESHQVKEDIAGLILNRSSATAGSGYASSGGASATPPLKQASGAVTPGDWTLSPSVIHADVSSAAVDTPYAKPASMSGMSGGAASSVPQQAPSASSASNAPPTSAQSSGHTRSRAYSELLRQSGVMSKYLGISKPGGQTNKVVLSPGMSRSRSESPPRSAGRSASLDAYDHSHLSGRSRTPLPVRSPVPVALPGKKGTLSLDSPPPPMPPPRHHHTDHYSSTSDSQCHSTGPSDLSPRTPASRSGAFLFTPYTPSRVVPWVLQGQHGAGGLYTPEGHINVDALDFDPASLPQEGYVTSEAGQVPVDEQLVSTIRSVTRVLILFHRWLLQRSDHRSVHSGNARSASLVLAAHFSEVTSFVSPLFGLEQWLRSKMRLIVVTEAKAYIFRIWNLKYGVSAQSR